MNKIIKNTWVYGCLVFFLIMIATGITYYLENRLWKDFSISNGEEMLAIYVGPFISLVLLSLLVLQFKLRIWQAISFAVITWVVIQLPLLDKVFETFSYPSHGDSFLYEQAARYMYQNGTLCSYDSQIIHTQIGDHYLYQPGYKYYLALLMNFTGGEINRSIQWTGLFLIVLVLAIYIWQIATTQWGSIQKILALVFGISIIPALIKNMLMGVTEWLAVLLMFLFFICWQRQRLGWAYLFLGFVVFVRQNLLPFALLIVLIDWMEHRKPLPILIFAMILSLPLIHNLYYAGVFRYFADYSWWAERWGITPGEYFYQSMIYPHGKVYLQYLAIDRHDYSLANSFIGFIFIPFSLVLFFILLRKVYKKNAYLFWVYLAVVFLLFLPTISYNGSSGFPRFQMMNFTAFLMLAMVILESGISRKLFS